MADPLAFLTLALLPGPGPRAVRSLLARGPLAAILAAPDAAADILGGDAIGALCSGEARLAAERECEAARKHGVRLCAMDEPDYPALLREVFDPPPVLWVRGSLRGDEGPTSVAVVGSRGATASGRTLATSMARDLATAGVTVVSGLARGIDTAAHEGALAARGRTVAVLGCGVDRPYPAENASLAARIVEAGGAVVADLPIGTPPLPAYFPRRNRILAGWGRGVVVVEAAKRSGALITARLGLEGGREVMAVPGHPSVETAVGTNQLIRDGAALVRDAADVAAELGLTAVERREEVLAGSDPVLRALARGPASVDEIQGRVGVETGSLLGRLTELELSGRVRRLPGGAYRRT